MVGVSPGDSVRLARALFPVLAGELDAALASRGGDPAAGFDDWLDGETAALRETMFGSVALADVPESEERDRIEQAFLVARRVADRVGLPVPQPEALADAGVDYARLAACLAADSSLTPVLAPHGLGADAWRGIFQAEAEVEGAAPETGSPLLLAEEVEREFARLDRAPDVPAVSGWTLRLIPSGNAPSVLGLSHSEGSHVTLPEMLMLQLARAAAGDSLLDTRSFTWLAGTLGDGKLAARHVYDVSERVIRINCRSVDSQGSYLGSRPPVS